MLNSNDFYTHLKNGGSEEDLKKAFENEVAAARSRIAKEKDDEARRKERNARIEKAQTRALDALLAFCKEAGVSYSKDELSRLLHLMENGNIHFGGSRNIFDVFPW